MNKIIINLIHFLCDLFSRHLTDIFIEQEAKKLDKTLLVILIFHLPNHSHLFNTTNLWITVDNISEKNYLKIYIHLICDLRLTD